MIFSEGVSHHPTPLWLSYSLIRQDHRTTTWFIISSKILSVKISINSWLPWIAWIACLSFYKKWVSFYKVRIPYSLQSSTSLTSDCVKNIFSCGKGTGDLPSCVNITQFMLILFVWNKKKEKEKEKKKGGKYVTGLHNFIWIDRVYLIRLRTVRLWRRMSSFECRQLG